MKPAAHPETEPPRSVILGTAGHIDHGKTALVLALTGTDTDRLPEEKTRGITIDLGFAALTLTDAHAQHYSISLIDVPGHHAFIRNMLAGAGGIDCVMLIIAADEGVKAQTREHLEICTLLGITRGLVVLTKRDIVTSERLAQAHAEARHLLAETPLRAAPIVAVSAFTREGLPELRTALAQLVASTPRRSHDHTARLPLDRTFTVRGFGTVVTGTLQAGRLRADHTLQLLPADQTLRVRGLQVHNKPEPAAEAPNRVALNLAGVEVAEIQRGDTLVEPGTLVATRALDAELTAAHGATLPRHRARVRLHAFTSETLATVLRYHEAAGANEAAGITLVRLRLDKPVVLAPGDRFVLRQPSPAATVAGGRVLDATPLPRQRKAAAQAWLQQLLPADRATQLLLRTQRRGLAGLSLAALAGETGLTTEAVQRSLRPLLETGRLVTDARREAAPTDLLTREALTEAATALLRELLRGKGEPISAAELRSRTRLSPWVFDLALQRIARERRIVHSPQGLVLEQTAATAPGLSPRQQQVDQLYSRAGLAAPIFSEAAAQLGIAAPELRTILTALLRAQRLLRLGSDDLLVHASAVQKLTAVLRQQRGQILDVARFKTLTGLTRKHAIPLLEYLDGARVTSNNKGVRKVL